MTDELHHYKYEAVAESIEAEIRRNQYMLFSMLNPTLAKDGDQWCVLYGDNLQTGIAGFGATPHLAVLAWNAEWHKKAALAAQQEQK